MASLFRAKIISCLGRALAVTGNGVRSSLVLSTLKLEAIHSFRTSVLTELTRRQSPEDLILFGI
jgi:hypothetical protein